ncbi:MULTISPECIES: lipoyl(octanoyl) transferase LipB [unclassified Sphingomonas]|uniref:lipoyl(octanoyl) transferase LipB n=1 Tax=unclassified Sphingomonas TaxID=196159 RepID=UPI000BD5E069|nr:MAG: lipoate-protein ligase B [Sphingomonas sp. 32-62-10]OYY66363.1 MAG: lipoate-protein ligase B [Sphingomonas sp. 28-62-11]
MIDDVEWRIEPGLIDYAIAAGIMADRAAAIAAGDARELVWLLEHPPIYTAGTSADPAELIDARFPVHTTGRGGRYTYHGPGQRIGYVMLDLNQRGRDVRCFVHAIEQWVVATLGRLGIAAFTAPGRVGIWTLDGAAEAKIGAIGVRVKRWVTLHGFAVNVMPDLANFGGIVPCGLPDYGVTSIKKLGVTADFAALDAALALEFPHFLKRLSLPQENEA